MTLPSAGAAENAPGVLGRIPGPAVRPLRDGSHQPLVERHDSALLDLDGVLYIGRSAVPGAPEAVAAARAAGLRVAFVTNNASRTPGSVAEHLTELGIAASPDEVVTSAQAAAALVAEVVPPGAPVLVVGGEGLDVALVDRGFAPVRRAADRPAAVVQGFSPDVGWRLLAEGTYAVRTGIPWIASNLDATVPTARGLAPGNGALVEVVAIATGRRPVAAGKPELPLHREAMRRTGSRHPLVVGDRLDTDIEGANRAGVASLLVLTGVTTPVELALAEPSRRPTYVCSDLWSGLLEEHPPVVRHESSGWSCGGWVCSAGESGVALLGSGLPSDGLRALCTAVWHTPVLDPGMVAETVAGLGL